MVLHLLATFQISNGTSYFEDTTIGTGRERESFHCRAEHIKALFIGLCKLMNHTLRHLGIAMDTLEILVTLFLYLTGLDDPSADNGTRFTWLHPRELLEGYNGHFTMDVDSIEEGT